MLRHEFEEQAEAETSKYLLPHEIEEEVEISRASGSRDKASLPSGSGHPVERGEGVGPTTATHSLPKGALQSFLLEWMDSLKTKLDMMQWVVSCRHDTVKDKGVSLLEVTTPVETEPALISTSDENEPDPVAVAVTHKLVFWDNASEKKGRIINDLNSRVQREAKVGYMPKTWSKDLTPMLSGTTSGSEPEAKIVLPNIPVEVTRTKFMRQSVPSELKEYLDFTDSLRDVDVQASWHKISVRQCGRWAHTVYTFHIIILDN